MPLGAKVGLGPSHIVLQLPSEGAQPPIFGRRLLWPNGSPISATAEHLCHVIIAELQEGQQV